jgi:PhzF family phenazine biosynthesis protein
LKKFKFKKIDAFTKGLSSGNPAGCIYISNVSDITENEMQQLARELKGYVNEVAYVFRGEELFLRYFSSECEVDFCGHATIALMYDLVKNDEELSKKDIIKIKVKQDYLEVFNDISQSDSVFITAPNPIFSDIEVGRKEVSAALGIATEQLDEHHLISTVNAGLNTLVVPIKKMEDILKINPNQLELKEFCLENSLDIVIVFTKEVANSLNTYRTRVFAPKFGYLEDPATGSGNSAFGYYLLQNKLWDGLRMTIEQNNNYTNPNTVVLKTVLKEDAVRVVFGGNAVVRIDGEYILHS